MDIRFNFSWLSKELQDFMHYIYIFDNIRISIWIVGAVICSLILFYLLKGKKEDASLASSNLSFLNLVSKYNFNYFSRELIKKILAPQKKYIKFLENNAFFESVVQKYQAKTPMSAVEEEILSEIRKKLEFNTLNQRLIFFRSQQIHNGVVVKISILNPSYDIHFDSKILENYESYFLVSYPQIKNEDYTLIDNKELQINLAIAGQRYFFKTRAVLDRIKNKTGIQLFHSSNIEKE